MEVDILNFNEIIKTRQSCRKFDGSKSVDSNDVKKIVKALQLAPSARNLQPYSVYVLQGEEAKKISKCHPSGFNVFMENCSTFFVIVKNEYEIDMRRDFRDIDIGILASYITLAATDLGLSTCILGAFDEKAVQELLEIEDEVSLIIPVGYPESDEIREKTRKDEKEIIHFM